MPARAGADRLHPHRRSRRASWPSPAPPRVPGFPYTLSTLATRSIEEVAAVSDGAQVVPGLRVARPRPGAGDGRRAPRPPATRRSCSPSTPPCSGRRERDVRRGFTLPPKIGLGTIVDGHPPPARGRGPSCAPSRSVRQRRRPADGRRRRHAVTLAEYINAQFDPTLSWRDVEWLRSIVGRPDRAQGHPDRRRRRARGRRRRRGDRAVEPRRPPARRRAGRRSTLVAPVADAVGDRIEIICDGGVRRGSDIVKAVALGADACMVGRPTSTGSAPPASAASTTCSTC